MSPKCSVPMWSLLAGQCILTIVTFIAILVNFTLQMEDAIQDEVLQRIQDRIEGIRTVLMEPFIEGYDSVQTLALMTVAAPVKYLPSEEESVALDVDHFRFAGAEVHRSTSLIYILQVYESRLAPINTDGYPFTTIHLTSSSVDAKAYGGRYNYFRQQAWENNDTVYAAQPMLYQGGFSTSNIPMLDTRLNDTKQRTYWTNYPLTYSYNVQKTVINTTTGLPQTIEVEMIANSKMAMFSNVLGPMGQGLRLHNNWMLMAFVDLHNVESLLLTLTDYSKGESDSYAALYDISAADEKDYMIIAVSHPSIVNVVNSVTQRYFAATQSSSANLNSWFSFALDSSRKSGNVQAAIHTKERFISYSHIAHNESNLQLFAVVSTAEYQYFAKVKQTQATLIGVGVLCAVIIVALGCLIIVFTSLPIRGLKQSMGYAATLQNERVIPNRSFLSEIDSLCVAFAKMNEMLSEAKAYMPASMLVRFITDDEEIDDEEEGGASRSHHASSALRNSVNNTSASQSTRHKSLSYDDGFHPERTGTSGAGPKHLAAESISQLRSRRVALLVINIRGFTHLSDFSSSNIAGHYSALLDCVCQAANNERGILDTFHGDHFILSFNAVKAVGTPGKRAVQCSASIHQSLSRTPFKRSSMGVSCGPAIVGPLGNSAQRRFSIIGSCYTKALKLQKIAAAIERSIDPLFGFNGAGANHNTCFHCLIDLPTKIECGETFASVFLGLLKDDQESEPKPDASSNPGRTQITFMQQPNASSRLNQQIHAVVVTVESAVKSKKDDDEWMYEIHEMALRNPFVGVNEAMEAAINCDFDNVMVCVRDRIAQLLMDAKSDAQQTMTRFLSFVATYLELELKVPQVPLTYTEAFRRPEDVAIQFKDADICLSHIASQRPSNVVFEQTPSLQADVESKESETPKTTPRQPIHRPLTPFEIAEAAEWLRIARLIAIAREGFMRAVTY